MAAIAGPAFSCEFNIPPTNNGHAIDPNGVTAVFTPLDEPPQIFSQSLDNCGTGDWYFSQFDADSQPTELALCPNACAASQREGASLRFVFTCLDG
jgi:hypothetical protein